VRVLEGSQIHATLEHGSAAVGRLQDGEDFLSIRGTDRDDLRRRKHIPVRVELLGLLTGADLEPRHEDPWERLRTVPYQPPGILSDGYVIVFLRMTTGFGSLGHITRFGRDGRQEPLQRTMNSDTDVDGHDRGISRWCRTGARSERREA
jgi:hypothetical protein